MSEHGCSRLPRCLRGDGEHAAGCVDSNNGKIVFFVGFTPEELNELRTALSAAIDGSRISVPGEIMLARMQREIDKAVATYGPKEPK